MDGQDELRELAAEMRDLADSIQSYKERTAELTERFDELRLKKIPEKMEALGVKTVTYPGIGRVQTATDLYANTKAGQKEAGIQWLRDCGYDGMISEGYNASSVKALFRQMLKDGQPIPDEIFNVTPFIRASIVKA